MQLTQDQARKELIKLKGSLVKWLKVRDLILSKSTNKVAAENSLNNYIPEEVALKNKLKELLETIEPDGKFPNDPVELAKIVLSDKSEVASPQATSGILPYLIVGGAVIILLTVIKNIADAAAEKRRLEACKDGIKEACPFPTVKVLLIAGTLLGTYLIWTKTDVKDWLGNLFKTKDKKHLRGRHASEDDNNFDDVSDDDYGE